MQISSFVLIEEDHRYLLIQETSKKWKSLWFLPGGKIRKGESPETALLRETLEETGCNIKIEGMFYFIYYNTFLKPVLHIYYKGTLIDRGEQAENKIRWATYSQLGEIALRQNLQDVVDTYRHAPHVLPSQHFMVMEK